MERESILDERRDITNTLTRDLLSNLECLERLDGEVLGSPSSIQSVEHGINKIETTCREILISNQAQASRPLSDWFEVGLAIVQVSDYRPTFWGNPGQTSFQPGHGLILSREAERSFYLSFDWPDTPGLQDLLTRLGTTLDQLFPQFDDSEDGTKDGILEYPEGHECLSHIDLGVSRMAVAAKLSASIQRVRDNSQRPAFHRDHQWLAWYEEQGETYKSNAKIRDLWNKLTEYKRKKICPSLSMQIDTKDKGRDTVKKGVKKALEERKSSGSLALGKIES